MNPKDAGRLLLMAKGAWPNLANDRVAADLWLRYIERQNVDVANMALDALVERCQFPPTIAEWQEACRSAVAAYPARNELESREPSLQESAAAAKKWVPVIRQQLAEATGFIAISLRRSLKETG